MPVFYDFFASLLWVAVVALIIFLLRRSWRTRLVLSKEDALSQLFLLLSVFFLGITLLAFNDSLDRPVSWRTILFATSVTGLIGAYCLRAVYVLAFSLGGLSVWWGAQAFQWALGNGVKNVQSSAVFVGLAFLGVVFYSFGRLHEKILRFRRFAAAYLLIGIVVVTGLLFTFSTKVGMFVISEMTKGVSFYSSWQLTLALVMLSAVAIGSTLYGKVRKLLSWPEALGVLALVFLFGIMVLLPEQAVSTSKKGWLFFGRTQLSGTGYFWALVYNAAVFFELLGLILVGYARRETWLVNLGSLFLFLLIVVKYFDWFFTFLDKSVFFIGAGILLFAVGWLMERGRRYMISSIKAQTRQSVE